MKSIDSTITNILKPIFNSSRQNFIIINNLVKNWNIIIGESYAKFCYPKTVKFNKKYNMRKSKVKNDTESSNAIQYSQKQPLEAELVIAGYNSAISFILESESDKIIEKIASFYGYKAISKIKIVQEPKQTNITNDIKYQNFCQRICRTKLSNINKSLDIIDDSELKAILQKIAINIAFNEELIKDSK